MQSVTEAVETKSENEESVGASIQATEVNIEVSATEKPADTQLNSETEAPKSENSGGDVVSAPLDTPEDDTQTPVTEKLNEDQPSAAELPKSNDDGTCPVMTGQVKDDAEAPSDQQVN